jgi:hypothetical protein
MFKSPFRTIASDILNALV